MPRPVGRNDATVHDRGAVGGIIFSSSIGHILERTGSNYFPIFLACGCAYLIALVIIQVLVPRLEPTRLQDYRAT